MKPEDLSQKISAAVKSWQEEQSNQTSGYEYEKSFVDLWAKLGKEVLQASLGDEDYDKNRKKK